MSDTPAEKLPRGTKTMQAIVVRMTPLADWLDKHKPGTERLCIERDDYDFMRRWPNAASRLSISVTGPDIFWRHYLLYPNRAAPTRYVRPEQLDGE
jgi:hypothetical protein